MVESAPPPHHTMETNLPGPLVAQKTTYGKCVCHTLVKVREAIVQVLCSIVEDTQKRSNRQHVLESKRAIFKLIFCKFTVDDTIVRFNSRGLHIFTEMKPKVSMGNVANTILCTKVERAGNTRLQECIQPCRTVELEA